MAECSHTAADISRGCSENQWWCGCGLLRDANARRVEREGETRTEFSVASAGMDGRVDLVCLTGGICASAEIHKQEQRSSNDEHEIRSGNHTGFGRRSR